MANPKYKRILIKLSGEALAGERGVGIDIQTVQTIAKEIQEVHSLGIEIALVMVEEISGVENLQQKQVWTVFRQITLECLGLL